MLEVGFLRKVKKQSSPHSEMKLHAVSLGCECLGRQGGCELGPSVVTAQVFQSIQVFQKLKCPVIH